MIYVQYDLTSQTIIPFHQGVTMKYFLALIGILLCSTSVCSQQMLTARQHYAAVATDVSNNHGENISLVQVVARNVFGTTAIYVEAQTGTAEVWFYLFRSPSDGMLVTGVALDHPTLGTFFGEANSESWPGMLDTTALPNEWIDSDIASAAWKSNGVSNYLATRPTAETLGLLLTYDPDGRVAWVSILTNQIDSLACIIDGVTAELIECGGTSAVFDAVTSPFEFSIDAQYPNPVRIGDPSHIMIRLNEPEIVQVDLVNMLGQQIAQVYAREHQPGTSTVSFSTAALSSPGIYIARITSGSQVLNRRIVVMN
ncbi:MAG: hypothetical protein C0600_05825 [Ignavibacteria bacterium]|nr:MAG: hypothetical protein C0600_05825 [Ignavibacteria bacterium]